MSSESSRSISLLQESGSRPEVESPYPRSICKLFDGVFSLIRQPDRGLEWPSLRRLNPVVHRRVYLQGIGTNALLAIRILRLHDPACHDETGLPQPILCRGCQSLQLGRVFLIRTKATRSTHLFRGIEQTSLGCPCCLYFKSSIWYAYQTKNLDVTTGSSTRSDCVETTFQTLYYTQYIGVRGGFPCIIRLWNPSWSGGTWSNSQLCYSWTARALCQKSALCGIVIIPLVAGADTFRRVGMFDGMLDVINDKTRFVKVRIA